MILEKSEIKGLKFFHRKNSSDLKTFEEVIGKDVYQKRGIKIKPGEKWLDCGGNVGAFTLLAARLGAKVKTFEPDPGNFAMIKKNLALNGLSADLVQGALVHDQRKTVNLYVGNNNQFWRNSIVKNWNGKGVQVKAFNFEEQTENGWCCKMDIEGAEMPIVEATNRVFKKFVFEWSFDIDNSLERYWRALDRLKKNYHVKASEHRDKGVTIYPPSWFPLCENVYCEAK